MVRQKRRRSGGAANLGQPREGENGVAHCAAVRLPWSVAKRVGGAGTVLRCFGRFLIVVAVLSPWLHLQQSVLQGFGFRLSGLSACGRV